MMLEYEDREEEYVNMVTEQQQLPSAEKDFLDLPSSYQTVPGAGPQAEG